MSTRKLGPAALAFAAAFLLPLAAIAQETGRAGANKFDVKMWAAVGAGFAIGLGVLGGAMGQGRALTVLGVGIHWRSVVPARRRQGRSHSTNCAAHHARPKHIAIL